MSTLNQRIQVFYSKGRFRFKRYHIAQMGRDLHKLWKDKYPDLPPLPLVESKEIYGIFQVVMYPELFTSVIDDFLHVSVRNILATSIAFKEKQRPKIIDQGTGRKRKRIPVKNVPVYRSK